MARTFARNSIGNITTKLILYPINFVSSIIIARYLGAEDRGVYAYIVLINSFVLPFLMLGFGGGINYMVSSRKFEIKEVFFTVIVHGLLIGIVSAALIYLAWHFGLLGKTGEKITLIQISLVSFSILLSAPQ